MSDGSASTSTAISSSRSSSSWRRRSWMARASSRASPSATRASVRVVSSTTTRPWSWATDVPGRGVACTSTSSGARVTPPSVTLPSGWSSNSPARAAAMMAGMAAPSRLPMTGSSGRTRRASRSESAPMSRTSCTLSSSANTSSRAAWSAAARPAASVPPGSASQAAASGWRTRRPACARRVRARSTARRSVTMAADRARSAAVSAAGAGQRVRCTDGGTAVSCSATSTWYSSSARNGRSGAATRAVVTSASCRVRKAAARSAGRACREKRRRLRRRYHVERSSMCSPRRRAAARASYPLQRGAHLDGQIIAAQGDPSVEHVAPRAAGEGQTPGAGPWRLPAGEAGVAHEEGEHVPQDQQLAAGVVAGFPAEVDVLLRPSPGEGPAHDVDAHPLGGLVELDGVAGALVHRPPVGPEDEAVAEEGAERRLAPQHRAHRQHRVEPVAELAGEALGHEVGREPLRPEGRVLAEVHRAEGHDARVKPGVAHVGDAPDRRATGGAGDGHRVDPRTVRRVALELRPAVDGALAQLVAPADDGDRAAGGALVDRQRQAPVALLADHPVVHVAQPVELTLVAEAGDPGDAVDLLHDLVAQAGVDLLGRQRLARLVVDGTHRDVPLVDEAEDERRPAAPAVRVAVLVGLQAVEAAGVAQMGHHRVGHVTHVAAGQEAEAVEEDAVLGQRRDHRQPQRLAQGVVLGAAAGGDVDDAGALQLADLVPRHDAVFETVQHPLHGRQVVEEAAVAPADELLAALLLEDLEGTLQGLLERPLAEPRHLVALAHLDVAQLGPDRGHDVGRQGPRRGRPHEQRLARAIQERQADGQAGVLAVLVALVHLHLRDARAAAGAPRHRVVALVQPAAAMALGEEAPDEVVVLVAEGEVGAAELGHAEAADDHLHRVGDRAGGSLHGDRA